MGLSALVRGPLIFCPVAAAVLQIVNFNVSASFAFAASKKIASNANRPQNCWQKNVSSAVKREAKHAIFAPHVPQTKLGGPHDSGTKSTKKYHFCSNECPRFLSTAGETW
jgi:hypothetical protein